jgi:Flp pilus assembly protein TadG
MIPSMKSFVRNTRGNVAIMFGFMAVPIIFVTGMTIDYSVAARVHTKLNAAADAAALAAVTPAMMAQSDTTATAAAKSMFSALMTGMSSLVYDPSKVIVTPTHPNGNTSIRNVTVSYTEQSKNIFAGVLGAPTIYVSGSATASASVAPNIDFYLLLDASGSMLLPSTTAGITQMTTLTAAQTTGGCAFACHQANTSSGEPVTNPIVGGKHIDNYQLARNNSIGLRTDEVPTAVGALMSTADTDRANAVGTPPVYRMSVSIFDDATSQIMPLTTSYTSNWSTASSNYVIKEMWLNNQDCNSQVSCTASGSGTGDAKTNYDLAFSTVNTLMPNPGNGTNVSGDKPQEILFLVTDGMEDELYSGTRYYQPMNNPVRQQNWCDTIKGRGIKIAALYTTYLPLQDPWSVSNVMPFVPNLGPAVKACATPGLYFEVSPGSSIASALSALFQLAVQSAHLTN